MNKLRSKIIRKDKAVTEGNNKEIANCGFRDEKHELPNKSFTFKTP